MLLETTSKLGNADRIYFVLQENGRYYLKNENGQEIPFYKKSFQEKKERYKSMSWTTICNSDTKGDEYFISVGLSNAYTELNNVNDIVDKTTAYILIDY